MPKLFEFAETRRDEIQRFRLTLAEKKLIGQKAADCGMSVSDYCRSCALSKPVRSRVVASVINELREIAQIQKDLYNSSDDKHKAFFGRSYMRVLQAAADAIKRVSSKAFMDF
ncbi:MAG: hypothetical protein Q7T21_10375 [Gallionella sp.]|nr:hypothetical protein [Gallionella sp.]